MLKYQLECTLTAKQRIFRFAFSTSLNEWMLYEIAYMC